MSTQPLPLSILCDVSVQVAPQGVVTPAFNRGLIIGTSPHIPSQGVNSRLRQYAVASFPANIVSDGFGPTDPEYIAAELYCSQVPTPQFFWIGRQDLTAIHTLTITSGQAPAGYALGDIGLVTQTGASGAQFVVTAEAAGVPTAVQLIPGAQGASYTAAAGLATTNVTGTGTGLEVTIGVIGESAVQALTACRVAQSGWYTAMVCGAGDADHVACAGFAQAATPQMQYLYTTPDAAVLAGTPGNVMAAIKAASFSRAHGTYASTQGGIYPSQPYVSAAVAGLASGLNTGLANSNFTLALKSLVGVYPEPLSLSQMATISGIPGQGFGLNGNTYVNFSDGISRYEQGVNGDGSFFDQILGLDMLAADCQLSIIPLLGLYGQTDAGQAMLLAAVNAACQRAVTRGFVAGGIWTGQTVLNLTAGKALPNGYIVQSPLVATQSQADRKARKALPIYVSIIEAGTQQSATIGVSVQI